jgi:hypothetical protein
LTNHSTKLQLQFSVVILAAMNELDEAWSQMIAGAAENAKASGRADVADYLSLKLSNDAIRQASVGWLFDSLIEIASERTRQNSSITIEREEPHEFPFRGAKMAGSLLRVRLGVRCLTLEAGWTRTPAHGFMRGGALAAARITHFGMPKSGAELILVRNNETPAWNSVEGEPFDSESLRRHFTIFLGN